jgi:hypothetical protein
VVTIIVFGTVGVTVLTAQRQQVNAPLVALSEDTAAQLNSGTAPQHASVGSVDMNQSLVPFVVIYTKSGQPVAGSGHLNGQMPSIPIGVLRASRYKDYSSVTWQPQGSLRFASVTVAANDYYVLSGQSLQVADRSSGMTRQITALGCILSLVVIAAAYGLTRPKSK